MSQAISSPDWWINSHYAFAAYVLPFVLVACVLQNAFTLAALFSIRHGIGSTTRAIFIALAVANMLNLLAWYTIAVFGNHGLRYLTHSQFYFRALIVACKTMRAIGFFASHCSHWLYVLLNSERLFAMLVPHRASRFRKSNCLLLPFGVTFVSGLVCAGFCAFMYNVRPCTANGGFTCLIIIKRRALWSYLWWNILVPFAQQSQKYARIFKNYCFCIISFVRIEYILDFHCLNVNLFKNKMCI